MVRAERSDGIQSRQTILQTAASLATIEGLAGLSIGKLAEHVGMSKSGLYAHFASKEKLQLATIETAREIFEDAVINPTRSIEDPIERLEALCDRYLGYVESRVFPGGCFFAAVAAEFDTHPGTVKAHVAEVVERWLATLTELLEAARAQGRFDANEDPAQLTFEIDAYLLMANMTFVMRDDAVVFERARRALRFRLDRALNRVNT